MLLQSNKTITRQATLVIGFSVLSIAAHVTGFSMAATIDLYVAVVAFVSVIISSAKKTAVPSLDALCVPFSLQKNKTKQRHNKYIVLIIKNFAFFIKNFSVFKLTFLSPYCKL